MINKKDVKPTSVEILMDKKLAILQNKGYIKKYEFQPESLQLFDGLKKNLYKIDKKGKKKYSKRKFFINPHVYTADFKVIWNDDAKDKYFQDVDDPELSLDIPFIANKIDNKYISWIETKPDFDRYNTHRMARTYILPIVWMNFHIYVQIIMPKKLIIDYE